MVLKEHHIPHLRKYTRAHELEFFDGLFKYERFKNLSVDDFPARQVPLSKQSTPRATVDPNEDSDGEVGDDFFKPSKKPRRGYRPQLGLGGRNEGGASSEGEGEDIDEDKDEELHEYMGEDTRVEYDADENVERQSDEYDPDTDI